MIKRPLGTVCLLIILFLFLKMELFQKEEKQEIIFHTNELYMTGTVHKKDLVSKGKSEVLYVKDVVLHDEAYKEQKIERVICYLSPESSPVEVGSRILVKGRPEVFEKATNPGQFHRKFYYQISGVSFRLSQANILAKSNEYDELKEALHQLRCYLAARLDAFLPPEDAAIMKAVLLGAKSDMEEEMKDLYQRNGIGHILAISGLHISLLGLGILKLLKRTGMPLGVAHFLAAVLMALYGLMTGFSVSMLRAVIMFLLHMGAKLVGRTDDKLTAAAVAAVLILLEQPLYFYYGGFVFSFGCVVGIEVVMPALTKTKNPLPVMAQRMLSGVAMAVISYPMYLWFYYQFPPYSMVLNLLVIPLMSLLMAAGLILLLMSVVFAKSAVLPAALISGILWIYEGLCKICDKLPWHVYTPGRPRLWQVFIYVFILLLVVLIGSKKKKTFQLKWKWGMVLLGILLLSIPVESEPELTFLDVGQGDCIFIKSETGKTYLIDGGSTSASSVGEYRIIPFLKYKGASDIEAIIVTHPDEDHINGILEILEKGKPEGIYVKYLILPEIEETLKNTAYRELEQVAKGAAVKVRYMQAGEMLLDGEMTLRCLNPKTGTVYREANEYSIVLLLKCGNFNALLTGDAEGEGERVLLQTIKEEALAGHITVLKAAHHGSKYSTSEELLELLKPQITVISCGKDNVYGHPHEETLQRLEEVGSYILTTPGEGAITVKWNDEIKVECFLKRSE